MGDITIPQNNWEGNGTIQAEVGDNFFADATASEAGGIDAEGTVSESPAAAQIFKTAANAGTLIGYDTQKNAPMAGSHP